MPWRLPVPDTVSENDFALLTSVTREAGALAASLFAKGVNSWDKSPGNPVSEADIAVNDLIKRRLLGTRPDYGWLSEETADDAKRLFMPKVWVVDPIDGTRAFIKGRDGFCVSVALVEAGRPVMAAICAPQRQQFFTARAGLGAQLNGVPIKAGVQGTLSGCIMLADEDLLKAKFWPEAWPDMHISKPNSIALRMAQVACGEADAAVALRPKNEWDLAAATLILAEAGGIWSDHQGQRPLFNRSNTSYATVVAATPALYPEILRRVKDGVEAWQQKYGKQIDS
jgi:myo-inositol-1(or 4)-monophosphatase